MKYDSSEPLPIPELEPRYQPPVAPPRYEGPFTYESLRREPLEQKQPRVVHSENPVAPAMPITPVDVQMPYELPLPDVLASSEPTAVDERIATERRAASAYGSSEQKNSLAQNKKFGSFLKNRRSLMMASVLAVLLIGTSTFAISSYVTHKKNQEIAQAAVTEADDLDKGNSQSIRSDGDALNRDSRPAAEPASPPPAEQAAQPQTAPRAAAPTSPKPPVVTPPKPPAVVPPPVATPPARILATKLLVVVFENQSYAQAKAGMPYATGLAQQYGHASNYTAAATASLPNYIAMTGGDTYSIKDDAAPSIHKITGTSVFGQAIASGKSAGVFVDGMQSQCAQTNGGAQYVANHNPWTYFVNERANCLKFNVPMTKFDEAVAKGTLPNAGMMIPNLCHSAHSCSVATADKWFKARMDKVFTGPDWKSGRLVVVYTFDEDDGKSGNKVMTGVLHPTLKNRVVTTPLTHYSLSRLYSEMSGTAPLKKASTAPSMMTSFGLPIR